MMIVQIFLKICIRIRKYNLMYNIICFLFRVFFSFLDLDEEMMIIRYEVNKMQ